MPHERTFSFSSIQSSPSTNDMFGEEGCYPYTRKEECTWHPDEVARKLSDLLGLACEDTRERINTNSSTCTAISNNENNHDEFNASAAAELASLHLEQDKTNEHLMSRGWSTKQARFLRLLFGKNVVQGKEDDDDGLKCCNLIPIPELKCLKRITPWFYPIFGAFISQFNEPLNIMLLISAAISLILKQTADAISIGLALTIVSLVAAVQEYRSEAALEKLSDLVPHTCTVMRDGQVRDRYPAQDLVVGDSILLSTGE